MEDRTRLKKEIEDQNKRKHDAHLTLTHDVNRLAALRSGLQNLVTLTAAILAGGRKESESQSGKKGIAFKHEAKPAPKAQVEDGKILFLATM